MNNLLERYESVVFSWPDIKWAWFLKTALPRRPTSNLHTVVNSSQNYSHKPMPLEFQEIEQQPARRKPIDPDGDVYFLADQNIVKEGYCASSNDESSNWSTHGTHGHPLPAYTTAVPEPLCDYSEYTRDSCSIDYTNWSSKTSEHHQIFPWISDDQVAVVPAHKSYSTSSSNTRILHRICQEEADRQLAEKLQADLNHDPSPTSSENLELSAAEKAFDFTMRLMECFEKLAKELPIKFPISEKQDQNFLIHPALELTLVSTDGLVCQAEKVFALQQEFLRAGKDVHVDTGFHYTHSINMINIKQNGLLSNQERKEMALPNANTNGSLFGDGIYTGNNPFSYHMFGGADLGLIVARLKGKIEASSATNTFNVAYDADTILGRAGSSDETCVLRSGSQCLALLQFNANTINIHRDDAIGNRIIHEAQKRIQHVIDECFNIGKPKTIVHNVRASRAAVRALLTPLQFMTNRIALYHNSVVEIIYYEAPTAVELGRRHPYRPLLIDTKQNPRPFVLRFRQIHNDRQTHRSIHERWLPELICSAPLPPDTTTSLQPFDSAGVNKTKPKFLFPCKRSIEISFARKGNKNDAFQWAEIFENMPVLKRLRNYAINHCDKCPICSSMHRQPDGHVGVGMMPTGSMRIDAFPNHQCSGFDVGTYVISYRFNEGVQAGHHPSPTQPYMASYRVCFLPMSPEGTLLLYRLRVAFMQGLTAVIGTSKTTRMENSIIWTSIPHKTKISPGRFGFPDPRYFKQANHALDLLGITRCDYLSKSNGALMYSSS